MKYILPLVLWMAVIFVSSSLTPDVFPKVDSWILAKLVHLVYFGFLALLVQRALRHQEKYTVLWKYVQLASILVACSMGPPMRFISCLHREGMRSLLTF